MDIFSFIAEFSDEEAYRLHIKEERDKQAIICKKMSV